MGKMKKSEFKNADANATRKQTWLIFCKTKKDVRDEKLTRWEASQLIDALMKESSMEDRLNTFDDFMDGRKTGKKLKKAISTRKEKEKVIGPLAILKEAEAAGQAAMEKTVPTPMVVQQHENMMDDNSPVSKQWLVPTGPCGFAWVVVKCKGKGAKFINALKKEGLAGSENSHCSFSHSSYYKGFYHHIHEGGQSYELKTAYAHAFAEVLSKYEIPCYSGSRLD